ncbi:MAG: metabolite traffic protein EboE [Polyangiales bacterium]
MRLPGALGQLTYCTNIHAGEGLADVEAALGTHAVRVKELVSPHAPFAVGLRLSARAARELDDPGALERFRRLLARHDLYVFTINGFPHGDFHGTRVKERVYQPDWREDARVDYSDRLARLLAELMPADQAYGSVSTVPGAYKACLDAQGETRVAAKLVNHVEALVRIERASGRRIVLALEPEPCCMLETVAETVAFFEQHLWSLSSVAALSSALSVSYAEAGRALRRHVGVCLDLCHAAVEFESPHAAVDTLARAGIPIAKLQISAGLTLDPRVREAREALFQDDVYLHQVVAREGARLTRYTDLPEALDKAQHAEEWRVHFHVPIFHEALGQLGTTQGFVRELLARHRVQALCPQLEVETYTWDVLPEALRALPVHEAIAHELRWVERELTS